MSGLLRELRTDAPDFGSELDLLTDWDASLDPELVAAVARIIADVRERGDAVLLELTARFDGLSASTVDGLRVAPERCREALAALPPEGRESLEFAAERIRAYHAHQRLEAFEYVDALGHRLGQRVTPLARVGVYAPGGRASYPSTVLMSAIPARVAGVDRIVLTTPASAGELNPWVLAAAAIAGVDEVWAIGGAQAIAALAWGTTAIDRVDKIVGPGGAWVAAAKQQVFGPVGIDMVAGPSEILVIADESAPVEWLVCDLFSQAEHDESAQSILVTPSTALVAAVQREVSRQLAQAPRAAIIERSLCNRGAIVITRDLDEAVAIANRVAPEHLQLMVGDPDALLGGLRNAGAIFIGAGTGEVVGDYVAGPSHVLPTAGTARYASPLSVYDFVKRTSLIRCDAAGLGPLLRHADRLAQAEGLDAHAAAARLRLGTNRND